jgi:hypothetical protein
MNAMSWIANARVQVWFNGFWMVFWLVAMFLTPLFHSLYSEVIWVTFISTWSLFATHLGAWISALVNVKAERIDDRTEEGNHLLKIEDTEDRLLLEMGEVETRMLTKMEAQHREMLDLLRGQA